VKKNINRNIWRISSPEKKSKPGVQFSPVLINKKWNLIPFFVCRLKFPSLILKETIVKNLHHNNKKKSKDVYKIIDDPRDRFNKKKELSTWNLQFLHLWIEHQKPEICFLSHEWVQSQYPRVDHLLADRILYDPISKPVYHHRPIHFTSITKQIKISFFVFPTYLISRLSKISGCITNKQIRSNRN